jgi:NADH-quinone oxidoreductase subunit G
MSAGLAKMKATLIPAGPFDVAAAVAGAQALVKESGSIILVGERAATSPGALKAVADLASATGAKLAWIPRRAGDRGALDAGLLPVGGRDIGQILAASGSEVKGLVVGGVSDSDVDGDLIGAVKSAYFTVSLETRHSAVTEYADVVFPVAVVTEKAGTFRNWEGRDRSFKAATPVAGMMSDADVLGEIAREMGSELSAYDFWSTANKGTVTGSSEKAAVGNGQAVLSTWKHLLDQGTLQEGEPYLAATSRVSVIRVSPATARSLNLVDGGLATVECCGKKASAPVIETAGMVDGVVWIPTNSEGAALNLPSGCVVNVSGGVA